MPEEIDKIRRELGEAKEAVRIRELRIADLDKEVKNLRGRLDAVQKKRPKLKPENLITSFRTALEKMQEGLKTGEGRVGYTVSKFDTDLKLNLTLDEQGEISFQLPELGDSIPAENLSSLHLSINPSPIAPVAPAGTAEVPNLIGVPRDRAVASLKKAELKAGKVTERTSLTAPGTVIEQDPAPYSRIEIGSPIDMTVSKAKGVKVPNLIGMEKDDAVNTIEMSQLTAGKMKEEVSDSPAGTVISQSVTAGTLVPIETPIDLVIAKAGLVKTPKLVGKTIRDAKGAITRAKLKLGKVTEATSEKPKGTVIKQSPEAGEAVPPGTPMDLVIARPEAMVAVPNLVGMKRKAAERVAIANRLKMGAITEKESTKARDTIIAQKPKQGAKVPAGTAIALTISKGRVIR